MLNFSSLNLVADDLRRKVETIDRLKDIKVFWDEDLPLYRNKNIEEILTKLLEDAPIKYVEDDVLAAWMSYMESQS